MFPPSQWTDSHVKKLGFFISLLMSSHKFEAEEVADTRTPEERRAYAAMAAYTVRAAEDVRRAAVADLLALGEELRSSTSGEEEESQPPPPHKRSCVRSSDMVIKDIDRKLCELLEMNNLLRQKNEEINARLNAIETSVSDIRDYEEAAVRRSSASSPTGGAAALSVRDAYLRAYSKKGEI